MLDMGLLRKFVSASEAALSRLQRRIFCVWEELVIKTSSVHLIVCTGSSICGIFPYLKWAQVHKYIFNTDIEKTGMAKNIWTLS